MINEAVTVPVRIEAATRKISAQRKSPFEPRQFAAVRAVIKA
jgi:hypothetical protein